MGPMKKVSDLYRHTFSLFASHFRAELQALVKQGGEQPEHEVKEEGMKEDWSAMRKHLNDLDSLSTEFSETKSERKERLEFESF